MENKLNDQLLRNIMLFHFDQGYTLRDSFEIINLVYGPRSEEGGGMAVTLRTVVKWFKMYQTGDRSTADRPHIGRSIRVTDEQILDSIKDNGDNTTLNELSQQVNLSI